MKLLCRILGHKYIPYDYRFMKGYYVQRYKCVRCNEIKEIKTQ